MTLTKILAVSGSLRARSTNTELLKACALLAPQTVTIQLYEGLGTLEHYNADLDTDRPPPQAADWRRRVAAADALLFSSPEYARGVPGSLKNALDWLVGGSEIVEKPVALINGSPRASHAQASLALTLQTISAHVINAEPYLVPVLGKTLAAREIAQDETLAAVLRSAVQNLVQAAAPRASGIPKL